MKNSSENMSSSSEVYEYGSLLFFRKDGGKGTPYPLTEGLTTIGSSQDADVRLKINDDCLEDIHCALDVSETGIATIINKSLKAPVKVNDIIVRNYKVLKDEDIVEIVGKKFQYLNDNISNEEIQKREGTYTKKVLTPSNRRKTMAPLLQIKSGKKSPNLKVKSTIQLQRKSLKRKSEGPAVNTIALITPEKRPNRSFSEKPQTTSKLVVSKALGSNASTTKRRLSLGSGRKKSNTPNSRVSARNIQFGKNTITSMITEEEEKPSLSMKTFLNSTPVNKKLEAVRKSSRTSLPAVGDLIRFSSPRKSILKFTPRKSHVNVDDPSDLLTKTVSFSNIKLAEGNNLLRKSGNRRSVLASDETDCLRLSSSSSVSPLKEYQSEDSLFSASDTESPKKVISSSRLSLKKSMESQSEKLSSRKSRSLARASLNKIGGHGDGTPVSRDAIVTSSKKSISKQRRSSSGKNLSGVSSRKSIVSSNSSLLRNTESSSEDATEDDSATVRSLRKSDRGNSFDEETPLSPIHPIPRRSASTRKLSKLDTSAEVTGLTQNRRSSIRSYRSTKDSQDEEDRLLNSSEENLSNLSEGSYSLESIESSFENNPEKKSLTGEGPPRLSGRRSSVRKSHSVNLITASRRSSVKTVEKSVTEDFGSSESEQLDSNRSSRKSRMSLLVNIDEEPERKVSANTSLVKGRKSSVPPSKGRTPSSRSSMTKKNDKSHADDVGDESDVSPYRNKNNSTIGRLQDDSNLSLGDEVPVTNRRSSIRKSNLSAIANKSINTSEMNKSNRISVRGQEVLTSDSDTDLPGKGERSLVRNEQISVETFEETTPQPGSGREKRKSSVLPAKRRTPQSARSSMINKNDKSHADEFGDESDASPNRNRTNSTVGRLENDSTLSLDEEIPAKNRRSSIRKSNISTIANKSINTSKLSKSIRKSLGELQEDLTSDSETGTGERSLVKNDQLSVNIFEEITPQLGSGSEKRKSSVSPAKGRTPQSTRSSTMKMNDKSHIDDFGDESDASLQNDSTLSLNEESPAKNRRSSIRKSNIPLVANTSINTSKLSKSNRKPLGELHEDLTSDSETNLTEAGERSLVKNEQLSVDTFGERTPQSRKSSVSPAKSRTPQSARSSTMKKKDKSHTDNFSDESYESPRKNTETFTIGQLQNDLNSSLSEEIPATNRRSSVRKSNISSIVNKSMNTSKLSKSYRESVGELQGDLTSDSENDLTRTGETFEERTPQSRSGTGKRKSVGLLHEDLTLPLEDLTPQDRSSRKNRGTLGVDETLPLGSKTPQQKNRSSVKYEENEDNITLPQNQSGMRSTKNRKSSIGDLEKTISPIPRNKSSVENRNSFNNLHEDSTLPLEEKIHDSENRSFVRTRKSSIGKVRQDSTSSVEESPSKSSLKIRDPSGRRSSRAIGHSLIDLGNDSAIRKSSARREQDLVSEDDSFLQNEALFVSLKEQTSDKKRISSATKSNKSLMDRRSTNHHNSTSSLEDSVNTTAKTPEPYRRSVRNSKFEDSNTISIAHSTLNEDHSLHNQYVESSVDDLETTHKSEESLECDNPDESQTSLGSRTPETSRRSSRRANKSSTEYLHGDGRSQSDVSLSSSLRDNMGIEVIYLSDSTLDGTPENNTSVVFIDTPLNQTRKAGHSRLSKTIHSTIEDVDLTTPKSAIKSRRRKSSLYQPETEDITIVTPLGQSENENGIKTPLNTPGLFENIRKSVLKSRSQMQQSSSNLAEELSKAPRPNEKASKRQRESYGESVRANKRRKLIINEDDSFESNDGSFESFQSDEALTDFSSMNLSPDTPTHFSDLTDKPVITHPPTRFSTGNRTLKRPSSRRSLPISSTIYKITSSNTTDADDQSEDLEESSEDIKWVEKSPESDLTNVAAVIKLTKTSRIQNSPKNDLSDVAGVKKLLATPKVVKSPKNDLTNIAGVRKLLATPRNVKSPKNDLTYVAGVKKIMSTPKEVKSPKNDLTNVAGVKKLLRTPREMKSPKNDLVNIVDIKKLLATPKEIKSPKNDLTRVPNLRNIMSPKYQNSPLNDLGDVRGVKKLMRTPKESKDPLNELSDVEGLADLFNISGVHRLSNTSDIENNEELFDKLMDRRPLKTYRGKSMSPNKGIDSYGARRKTLGDQGVLSPRVEDWLQDQAVMKSKRLDDKAEESSGLKDDAAPPTRSKKTRVEEIKEEIGIDSPPKRGGRRKAVPVEESKARTRTRSKTEDPAPPESPAMKTTRGKSKKVKEGTEGQDDEIEITKYEDNINSESPKAMIRGGRKATRGRKMLTSQSEESEESAPKKATRGRNAMVEDEKSNEVIVVESLKTKRGRKKKEPEESVKEKVTRGRNIKVVEDKSDEATVVVESPRTTTRSRKKVVAESPVAQRPIKGRRKVVEEEPEHNETVPETAVVVKAETPLSDGSDEKIAQSPAAKKPTRGRKNAVEQTKSEESPLVSIDSPRSTRTRRNVKIEEEQNLEKATRGSKRNVAEVVEAVPSKTKPVRGRKNAIIESSDDNKSETPEIEFKKPSDLRTTRGRKTTKVTDVLGVSDISSEVDTDSDYVPEKPTKGAKKGQKEQDSPVASPKPTRGRRKAIEVVENTDEEPEESSKRTKRGRNVKTVQSEESNNELLVSSTDMKKSQPKAIKVAPVEDEISSAQVDSTTGDFSPVPSEDNEEEIVLKPTKGRKTKRNEEVQVDEKPAPKRPRRGRKVSSDDALNVVVGAREEPEVEDVKVTKSRAKKAVPKKESSEVPTRGGKQKVVEEDEPVRATRGRKQKVIKDITEEPLKKSTKKDKKADEEIVASTKKTGRAIRNKAVARITEEETSSPKTRSLKGNFNKYGSSFEVESPGKTVGRKRKVRFE
ncbi:hypothetical protein JTB14_020107 [Gonioctena quinquepunctata]|nr:hypothetical protein JTB14_020107 [Gonioctena quinquepunctata]